MTQNNKNTFRPEDEDEDEEGDSTIELSLSDFTKFQQQDSSKNQSDAPAAQTNEFKVASVEPELLNLDLEPVDHHHNESSDHDATYVLNSTEFQIPQTWGDIDSLNVDSEANLRSTQSGDIKSDPNIRTLSSEIKPQSTDHEISTTMFKIPKHLLEQCQDDEDDDQENDYTDTTQSFEITKSTLALAMRPAKDTVEFIGTVEADLNISVPQHIKEKGKLHRGMRIRVIAEIID